MLSTGGQVKLLDLGLALLRGAAGRAQGDRDGDRGGNGHRRNTWPRSSKNENGTRWHIPLATSTASAADCLYALLAGRL